MLRRPLTIASLSFAGGIYAAGLLAVPSRAFPLLAGAAAAAVLLFLCFVICKNYTELDNNNILEKKLRPAALIVTIFFICGFTASSLSLSRESQLAPFEGSEVSLSGTVADASLKEGNKASLTVRLTAGEPLVCSGKSREQRREKILVKI